MPKRRTRQAGQRRLGRRSRAHLRLVRELKAELPYETALRETAARHAAIMAPDLPELATVTELNPPPVFGDTIVLASSRMRCPSCDFEVYEGAEVTYIDGELNCAECTEEARRG